MKNKINFCTLFDSNYLHFGLSLYSSLEKYSKDFHLFIFAFDDKCEEFLKKQNLKNATIISLKEFEDERLLTIRPTRSKGEYCWTSTPSTVLYILKNFNIESCTYIDADLFFFSDPKILIEEMGDKSVSIIEHRYSKSHDQSKDSGKYCVQFMTFKNNPQGLEVLNWWRDRCIEWCYNRVEDGKFGDQKYLDDWMERFDCVRELHNLGGGVAPWNVEQYDFFQENGEVFGIEKSTQKKFKLVFYHFHAFKLIDKNFVSLTAKNYEISDDVVKNIYQPYLLEINKNADLAVSSSNFLEEIKNKKLGFFKKFSLSFAKKKNIIKRK